MKKKDLLKKQELAEELGMRFDEASELFSEETLETMRMVNITGGSTEGDNTVERCGCVVNNNVERCGCDESDKKKQCGSTRDYCGVCNDKGGDKCDKCGPGSTTLPTTPPITEPTEDLPVTTTT